MQQERGKKKNASTFAAQFQNTRSMSRTYQKYTDFSVEMNAQEEANMNVIRGKGLLNTHEHRFTFVENPPRGPRSVEVGRTKHCRFVRRPDGEYTATLRFAAGEKYLLAALIAEVRSVYKQASEDYEKRKEVKQC